MRIQRQNYEKFIGAHRPTNQHYRFRVDGINDDITDEKKTLYFSTSKDIPGLRVQDLEYEPDRC